MWDVFVSICCFVFAWMVIHPISRTSREREHFSRWRCHCCIVFFVVFGSRWNSVVLDGTPWVQRENGFGRISLFTTVPLNSWEGKATRDLVSPELNLHFKKKPRRRRRSRGLKRVVKLREKCNLIQNSSKRVRWSWRLATAKSHSPSKLRKLAFSHEAE